MGKVKRSRIDWYKWLWLLGKDPDNFVLLSDFCSLRSRSKVKSVNRLAYTILRKHYSTTAIGAMRYLGGQGCYALQSSSLHS